MGHKQEIINEIGAEINRQKAYLVNYGTKNWGMSSREAKELAELTMNDLVDIATDRKAKGLPWKTLFEEHQMMTI